MFLRIYSYNLVLYKKNYNFYERLLFENYTIYKFYLMRIFVSIAGPASELFGHVCTYIKWTFIDLFSVVNPKKKKN